MNAAASFWQRRLAHVNADDLAEIRLNAIACEARRPHTKKPQKTGTISEAACLCLLALVLRAEPICAIEIGTFIGTSAYVLKSRGAVVYTCDKDNAAVTSGDGLVCYPKTTSTDMLLDLVSNNVRAELFFFDGRIQPDDLALILELSMPNTIYAFDDYEGREKGVINAGRLQPRLSSSYRLIPPAHSLTQTAGLSTIAALVTETLL